MIELPILNNNETPSFCAGCGNCCKGYAGWYHPLQVLAQLELLKKGELVELGNKYQIDQYDADSKYPTTMVLRPAHTNSLGSEFDASWGGTCVNYNNGCSLSFEDRPLQCKALVATAPKVCHSDMSKASLVEAWSEYQSYFENYK